MKKKSHSLLNYQMQGSKNNSLALDGLPIAVKDIFCVKGEKLRHVLKYLKILFQI